MFNPNLIILICWLIFLSYWILNWNLVKPTKETSWRAPGFRWTFLWMVIVIILVSHFLPKKNIPHFNIIVSASSSFPQIAGLVLTIIGLFIAIIARKMLADNWSSNVELKKDHTLITTGIYKYVRHPIYTGIIFMGIGTIAVVQSIITVFFYVIVTVFLIYKFKKEEQLLLKHFPKEYPEYMKKTKALIPFIY